MLSCDSPTTYCTTAHPRFSFEMPRLPSPVPQRPDPTKWEPLKSTHVCVRPMCNLIFGYSMLLRTKKTPKILHKGVSKEEKEKEKKHEPGLIVCTSSTYQKLHKGGFIRLLFRSGDPFWREMQAAGKGGIT